MLSHSVEGGICILTLQTWGLVFGHQYKGVPIGAMG